LDLVSVDSLTNARVNWSDIFVVIGGQWLKKVSCRWPVPPLIQDSCHTFPRLQRAKYWTRPRFTTFLVSY
jgi:hypothetical protein